MQLLNVADFQLLTIDPVLGISPALYSRVRGLESPRDDIQLGRIELTLSRDVLPLLRQYLAAVPVSARPATLKGEFCFSQAYVEGYLKLLELFPTRYDYYGWFKDQYAELRFKQNDAQPWAVSFHERLPMALGNVFKGFPFYPQDYDFISLECFQAIFFEKYHVYDPWVQVEQMDNQRQDTMDGAEVS